MDSIYQELAFAGSVSGSALNSGVEIEIVGKSPGIRRIVSAPPITALNQIGKGWKTIAVQNSKAWGAMIWDWSLHAGSYPARALLEEAVRDGTVLTVQGPMREGGYALYAKLAKHSALPSSFKKFCANQVGART
jgi:hypothetical protein